MHIIERTKVDHPAAKVWPLIVSPEFFQLWNDKVVSMDAKDRFFLGQTFTTLYLMNGKNLSCATKVTALEEARLLVLEHSNCTGQGLSPNLEVIERITLTESGAGSVVVKDVEIRNSGIPWFLVPVIWFITTFGKRVGPDKLKQLADANA
jgi:hypothetical protein